MKFFQQIRKTANEAVYAECERSKASHFTNNQGEKRPIAELANYEDEVVHNVPHHSATGDTEPLEMPVMNFEGETEPSKAKPKQSAPENPAILQMPTMSFDKPAEDAVITNRPKETDVLELPTW